MTIPLIFIHPKKLMAGWNQKSAVPDPKIICGLASSCHVSIFHRNQGFDNTSSNLDFSQKMQHIAFSTTFSREKNM